MTSDVRVGIRCVSCKARTLGTAEQVMDQVWMCATFLVTAKSKLPVDRKVWARAT